MPVTDIKILKETENYKITLCNVSAWFSSEGEEMERLELKIKNKWVFVKNYYHHQHEKDFEKYSQALEKAKQFNPNQGWFKVYGQGHPLDQFKTIFNYKFSNDSSIEIKGFDQLANFTSINRYGHIWQFWGNHTKVSAVFSFLIWDNKLKASIDKKLLKEIIS